MSPLVSSSRRQADTPIGAGLVAIVLLSPILLATGCHGYMQTQTGNLMSSYAVEHMVPDMMASDDLNMACEAGVSMGGFLMSFARVTDPPQRAGLVTMLAAGMCAEAEAWEADLRQIRAVRDGRAFEARDARIAEQRAHALAAERFLASYLQLEGAFGTPSEMCPELEPEDELFYFLGLAAGLLAVVHDRAAEGAAQVPMDIPQQVARAAACLDNDRWWGGPLALQASIWATVPGASSEGDDPWSSLEAATAIGDAHGVRLARAFQVQILEASGQESQVREAIAAHAASCAVLPSHPDWQLLDSYATRMILHISDRAWTQDRGHRTPLGALGTFWQPPVEVEQYDDLFDDLLDDLDEEGAQEPLESQGTETQE
ncbi:MAG: hypothetical protein JW797_17240 [Bradymonadales bacterium]|nr:hypothetical protein [Bradymonadales bacterium]